MENVRNPKQSRAIDKKERIIEAGFALICENGYYNTTTPEIAKKAGVSTGIVYQYFKDKYDILMHALRKYGDDLFFPMLKIDNVTFSKNNLEDVLKGMIKKYINNHKLSKIAHEEIMAMVHADHEVAAFYYQKELELTFMLKDVFVKSGFKDNNLLEKVHLMIGLIDNLCHEIIYHNHDDMNYDVMTNLVIETIMGLF